MGPLLHEPQQFESLWRDLLGFLRRQLTRRGEADDIAQEAIIEALEHPPEDSTQIRGWLRVVALRRVTRVERRDRVRRAREEAVARPEAIAFADDDSEPIAPFMRYVHELREPYRTVVRMRYLEESSIEEIAVRLQRPPATVRSQLKRGLDRIRQRLAVEQRPRRTGLVGVLPAFLAWLRKHPRTASTVACVVGIVVLTSILWMRQEHVGTRGETLALAGTEAVATVPRDETASEPAAGPPFSSDVASRSVENSMDSPSSWTVDLEGTVWDIDHSTVPDADIVIGNSDGTRFRIAARSDALGRFQVKRVDALDWVWAEKPGRLPTTRHFVGSPRGGQLDLELSHHEGLVCGRVLSHTGVPVAGARVTYRHERLAPDRAVIGPLPTLILSVPDEVAVTDADGRFGLLRRPNPGRKSAFFFVHAEGYPPLLQLVPGAASDPEIELRLLLPARVAGRIVGRDGMPVVQAQLELLLPEPFEPRTVTTREWGEFEIDGLPCAPYALRLLRHPSGALESCFVRATVANEDPPTPTQTIVLSDDSVLHGRVEEGGHPLAHRQIRLRQTLSDVFPPDDRIVRTDEDGAFAFTGCDPNGRFTVNLMDADGRFVQVRSPVLAPSTEPIRLSTESPREHAVLDAICEVEGAEPPTMVAVHGASLMEPLILPVARDGSFRTPPIPLGQYFLRFWLPSLGTWGTNLKLTADAPTARFHIGRPGALDVRILSPTGGTLPNAIQASLWVPAFLDLPGVRTRRVLELENGASRFELPPGERYVLMVRTPGFAEEQRGVVIQEGRTTLEEVRLQDCVSMRIELVGQEDLRQENFTINLELRDRTQPLWCDLRARSGNSDVLEVHVNLPKNLVGVRAESTGGWSGRMRIAPSQLVDGGILRIDVQKVSPR